MTRDLISRGSDDWFECKRMNGRSKIIVHYHVICDSVIKAVNEAMNGISIDVSVQPE